MKSLDFYRHKTVIPARGSWENCYIGRILRQIWNNLKREKNVAFFAYRTIGQVYAKKLECWMNDFPI